MGYLRSAALSLCRVILASSPRGGAPVSTSIRIQNSDQ